MLREDRALTGPTPGLTRDAVAVEWTWGGKAVRLVDTAGEVFFFLAALTMLSLYQVACFWASKNLIFKTILVEVLYSREVLFLIGSYRW